MSKKLKYSKDKYIDSGLYGLDDSEIIKCYSEKLIRIRKSHRCAYCGREILKGEYALREKCIIDGEGWQSCYTCTECIEKWLEESKQVDIKEVIE